MRADPNLKSTLYETWRKRQASSLANRFDKGEIEASARTFFRAAPIAINGALICGPVVASNNYSSVLKALDRKVLGVETESGGIFQAAQDTRIPALTIRGISDYADAEKSELEELMQGQAREIASSNAVTFLTQQLHNPEFLAILKSEREHRVGETIPGILAKLPAENPTTRLIKEVGNEIDLKLKELCPEFSLTQKGYHLPSPRLKPMRLNDDPRESKVVDILEAVEANSIVFVDAPRNYPDLALPWIWGDALTVSTLSNSQIIPIVLDANGLRPPSTIQQLIPNIIAEMEGNDGVQLVFIIYNVNPSSRSRSNHLVREIKQYPKARVVLITRGEGNLLVQHDIVRQTGGRAYSLCDVSFLSISNFIQTAFDLATSEAEVIAFKLKLTFSKFKLSAHPTYFAGIPRQMLYALLEANRRAELIQLAVDGYLTLIAAEDEERIHLNRSTRARYLARLAIELEVEKKNLSQAELVEFTRQFAREFDFDDLEPLSFINSFVQKGILQFKEERVGFTLPFVRSYLLATALCNDGALAQRYFDFAAEDFDFETFDLYAELGPSAQIIRDVEDNLDKSIGNLASEKEGGEEFLFSSKIRPALLEQSDRLGDLRINVQEAIRRLQERADDGEAKQKLLDIMDNANTEVEQKVLGNSPQAKGAGKAAAVVEIEGILRNWRVANVLLGAAAQRLPGTTKQRLAALLAVGGAAVADRLTRLYAAVEFKEIKTKVLNSNDVDTFLSRFESDDVKGQVRLQLGYLIDFIELYMLALPFRAVLNDLCDQSGDKVLSGSVDRAVVPEGLASLIRSTWLADLDSGRALPRLRAQLSEMPFAPFLRIALVQHLLARVYWIHSNTFDREKLLDAAGEVIKVFGATFNKRHLEQWLGKRDAEEAETLSPPDATRPPATS